MTKRRRGGGTKRPSLSGGGTETSVLCLQLLDINEARAFELEALGRTVKASRVRRCLGVLDEVSRTCKLRQCPICQSIAAMRRRGKALPIVRGMKSPELLLISYCSLGLHDLEPTLRALRDNLTWLRRTRLKQIRAAVGCIEPKLSQDRTRWVPHVHLIVDGDGIRYDRLVRAWRDRTDGRGTLDRDWDFKRRRVDPRNAHALVRYAFKSDDICPPPGTMSPHILEALWEGAHNARLPIWWGKAARSK